MENQKNAASLESTQPIEINSIDELSAYIQMWKSICKKGIQYLDITAYRANVETDEENLLRDAEFIKIKNRNSNIDIKIHQTELRLIESLIDKSEDTYRNYINLQQKVTRLLLYDSVGANQINDILSKYLAKLNELAASEDYAKLLLSLFEENGFRKNNAYVEKKFIRAILFRRLQFATAVADVLRDQNDFFNRQTSDDYETPQFNTLQHLLLTDSDLDYVALTAIFSAPAYDSLEIAGAPPRLLKTTEADYKAEYKSTIKDLNSVNEQLSQITLALRKNTSDRDRESSYDEIRKLNEKKELLSYVADQQYKKSGLINKAEVSAKNWVSDNLFDKKKAGKDAAKVFFCTTGAALGKALFYKLTHQEDKIDSDKLKNDIVNGLIETGLTAVGTFFLGPLGGSFTKTLMPFFRDEPVDPYMEEFTAIRKELSDGFTQMETKLDKISLQITTELTVVVSNLQSHTELVARKEAFLKQHDEVIALFKKVETVYTDLYFSRNSYVAEEKLMELDNHLEVAIKKMVSIFYHDKFTFNSNLTAPSEDSLCGKFFKFNQEAAVSFHATSRSLVNICDELVKIGETYLDLREKWLAALGTTMLFYKHGKSADPDSILHHYWDKFRMREDFSTNVNFELQALRLNIVGSGNCALLQNIETALDSNNGKVDFLAGFGLEKFIEPTAAGAKEKKPADLFAFVFENDVEGKGYFTEQPNRDFISRYVVAAYTSESISKSYYTIFTQQENRIPIPIRVHLRIMPNDTIGIYHLESTKTDKTVRARVLDPKGCPELSESLEAFFSIGETLSTKDPIYKKFSLPVKNQYLSIDYLHNDAMVEVMIFTELNSSKKVIGKYNYPINFVESCEKETFLGTFEFELSPIQNDKRAVLELTAMRASDKKKGSISIVISDHDAMKKAGMSRGIENVSTYRLRMPALQNGALKMVDVRTDNLRPFASNLLLAGDDFHFRSEETNHFGQVVDGVTGWRSLNGEHTLKAVNKNAWDVQLCSMKDNDNHGSVFNKYTFRNNYSGRFTFQGDGNFVMYDANDKAITATDTNNKIDFQKFAYLNNDGALVIVSIDTKESKKFNPNKSPEIISSTSNKRILSNRLRVGDPNMQLAWDYRIESENGKYYAEFWRDEIDSGFFLLKNSYEFSLLVRKQGGEIVKKALNSSHISKGEVYPSTYMVMQPDGNLVAYHEGRSATQIGEHVEREPLFSSKTNATENKGCVLCLTNEGKLFLAKTEERKIIKWLAE